MRNLRDGRVELIVRGKVEGLTVFDEQVRTGPRFCKVEKVELNDLMQITLLKLPEALSMAAEHGNVFRAIPDGENACLEN